jgi:hypothetical protein
MLPLLDSLSLGDRALHVPLEELARRFDELVPPPRDAGPVRLLVRRGWERGLRDEPESAWLTVDEGMQGDSWARSSEQSPESQLTAMEAGVAAMIANGQSWSLFGDQLFLDLDLSADNVPVGSLVGIGSAVLELTPKPHVGCAKYRARFGADALRFISQPELRPRHLRGVYLRVIDGGWVRVGDEARVLRRAGVVD